jgi:hypothetical protein
MRLGIFSDLHMEFSPYPYAFKPDHLYINAGDTHNARLGSSYRDLVHKFVIEAGSQYFGVLGNHDYYNGIFPHPGDGQFLFVDKSGLSVAGCTLWTKLSPVDFIAYKDALADYSYITEMTHEKYSACHESDLQWLVDNSPDIVVTHHSPSMKSRHPKWRGSNMDHFFHNNYDHIIEELQPKLWIHGHTHDAADYTIGKTRVICHPRGYPKETHFNKYEPKYLEVK